MEVCEDGLDTPKSHHKGRGKLGQHRITITGQHLAKFMTQKTSFDLK